MTDADHVAALPDQVDVLVYGATAGGVMAAIAASEEGARTLLVSANAHVGGMVSGGLGKSDVERQERLIRWRRWPHPVLLLPRLSHRRSGRSHTDRAAGRLRRAAIQPRRALSRCPGGCRNHSQLPRHRPHARRQDRCQLRRPRLDQPARCLTALSDRVAGRTSAHRGGAPVMGARPAPPARHGRRRPRPHGAPAKARGVRQPDRAGLHLRQPRGLQLVSDGAPVHDRRRVGRRCCRDVGAWGHRTA